MDVRFERTTNDPWSVDDAICQGIINSPGKRLIDRIHKLSLVTILRKHPISSPLLTNSVMSHKAT